MGATALYGLPYPDDTSSPYVHLDLQALAAAVEQELGARTLLNTERTTVAGPITALTQVAGLGGSFTLTRRTAVRLQVDSQYVCSADDTLGQLTVRLGSTVYRTAAMQPGLSGNGASLAAGRTVTLAAGSYTSSVWIERLVGTGTVLLDGSTANPIQFIVQNLGVVP